MPDKKITDYAAAGALSGTELLEIVQSATNKKMTPVQLRDWLDTYYPRGIPRIGGATINRGFGSGVTSDPASQTQGSAVNTLRASPFFTGKPQTYDLIQAEVTTLVGASSFRLGIYKDNGSGYPGALHHGTAALSGAANGVVSEAISKLLSDTLYWLALFADANITFRAWGTGVLPHSPVGEIITMGATLRQGFLQVTSTFGAMPDPFPTGAVPNAAANFMSKILLHPV